METYVDALHYVVKFNATDGNNAEPASKLASLKKACIEPSDYFADVLGTNFV